MECQITKLIVKCAAKPPENVFASKMWIDKKGFGTHFREEKGIKGALDHSRMCPRRKDRIDLKQIPDDKTKNNLDGSDAISEEKRCIRCELNQLTHELT